jgi:hypothetical protein
MQPNLINIKIIKCRNKENARGPPVLFMMKPFNFGEQPQPCDRNGIEQPRQTLSL